MEERKGVGFAHLAHSFLPLVEPEGARAHVVQCGLPLHVTVRSSSPRTRASTEGMEAELAQGFSLDHPAGCCRGWQQDQKEAVPSGRRTWCKPNVPSAHVSWQHSCSFHYITWLTSQIRRECENLRHFDGETGALLWAEVHLRSHPVRDHFSPHSGRGS